MSDERPKPSDDLVKWFKEATERITALDKQIDELVSKEHGFWKYSFSRVDTAENSEIFLDNQDAAKKEHIRVKEDIRSKRKISDFLKKVQDQQGVCPRCEGSGNAKPITRLSPLREGPEKCLACMGSGWKDGDKNLSDSITHALREKLD